MLFQTVLVDAVWSDGMCKAEYVCCMFRSKAAVMWHQKHFRSFTDVIFLALEIGSRVN